MRVLGKSTLFLSGRAVALQWLTHSISWWAPPCGFNGKNPIPFGLTNRSAEDSSLLKILTVTQKNGTNSCLLNAAPVLELIAKIGGVHQKTLQRWLMEAVAFLEVRRYYLVFIQVPTNKEIKVNTEGKCNIFFCNSSIVLVLNSAKTTKQHYKKM